MPHLEKGDEGGDGGQGKGGLKVPSSGVERLQGGSGLCSPLPLEHGDEGAAAAVAPAAAAERGEGETPTPSTQVDRMRGKTSRYFASPRMQ